MTLWRIASAAFASAGLLTVAGSLAWWWASYGDVYSYDYLTFRQAGLCLVGESEICRLATSLCRGRHPIVITAYSPTALWLGMSLLFASLIASGSRASTERG